MNNHEQDRRLITPSIGDLRKDVELRFNELYSTWYDLIAPDGHPIGEEILETIKNSEIEMVAIIGPPGAGKSILINQLGRLLTFNGIDTNISYFDNYLSEMEETIAESDPNKSSRLFWGKEEWHNVSQGIAQDLREKKQRRQPEQKRHVEILEIPGIGDDNQDLGFSTVNNLATELREKFLTIGIPADPRNQTKTSVMRRRFIPEVTRIMPEVKTGKKDKLVLFDPITGREEYDNLGQILTSVRDILETRFNTMVEWYPDKPETALEEGIIILETIRKSAPTVRINKVNELIENQERVFRGSEILVLSLPALREVPPKILNSTLTENMIKRYKLNISHMQHRIKQLVEAYGLPKDRGIVALNPYSGKKVRWFLHYSKESDNSDVYA